MLEKLFSKNRPQKLIPDDGQKRVISETDYQRFVFYEELFREIVAAKTALHNREDPQEIVIGVMKAACDLYDADWSGILITDLHFEMWRPEIWYEAAAGSMQDTRFHEFEMTDEYATWVGHLMGQKPLVIPDVEALKESSPKEYAAYQRLQTRAVIGVPFGKHPLGFMVVRNPNKNIEQYESLQIACFVAMMILEQKRRQAAERRFLTSEGEMNDGKFRLRYNILGQHSMEICGTIIREQDLEHPNRRGWLLLLYLALHKNPIDITVIARDLWPDEELSQVRNNNRQAIFRIHSEIAYHHDAKIIDTRAGAYGLADDIYLTTDAEEMEMLYEKAKLLPDNLERLEILKKAYNLYRGRLFEAGEGELGGWVIPFATHYDQIFVDITRELLTTLGRQKDYHCIIEYGSRAIRMEPGIQDAYYWVIHAAEKIGNRTTRDLCLTTAKEELTEKEYAKLLEMLDVTRDEPWACVDFSDFYPVTDG